MAVMQAYSQSLNRRIVSSEQQGYKTYDRNGSCHNHGSPLADRHRHKVAIVLRKFGEVIAALTH